MSSDYLDIVRHYEKCFMEYGDSCRGVDWPNEPDAQKRYKVMLDVIGYDRSGTDDSRSRIMDLGCGLGHLYRYMTTHGIPHEYIGVDISDVFVAECRKKYPYVVFRRADILKDNLDMITPEPDYIIMNGVFTERCSVPYDDMMEYFKSMLIRAFELCKKGIAFNVMSKNVDWERDDLFHLPLSDLSSFITGNLSRRFVIRNDYGLYEYTTYVYKDADK